MRIHNCEMLESWCLDERVPIELRKESGEIVLTINADTAVALTYCALCGKSLDGIRKSNSLRAGVCKHVKDLAAKPASSVRYRSSEEEYWIFGAKELWVRLFFCPICGRKLPLSTTKRYHKSPSEVARLTKLFANVKSIDQAIAQAGPPDFERGPDSDHFYWKGERLHVGFGRSLFYQHLAKTVDVNVVEGLDGKLSVKFFAKALERGPESRNVPEDRH